ncbi:MFS transporter [Acetobacter tropicalis]|uniref:MFS transporter n=1 Tax=Acetobacter tropicalis TaxID=104102 RepID=UPI000A360542|nr:MFS transporter [Acetobacter tropicalis]
MFDQKQRAATIRRISWRLLPFLMLCYFAAYIDRSNISIAALAMSTDLKLTAEMYGIAAGLFFITYTVFEIPSNLALVRFGARRWIARIMISWGLVAILLGFVNSHWQLYGVRLLLGAAEAGFAPGVIYYLSLWYPARELGRAMSFFYIGAALASVIGLPVSGLLMKLDGVGGISGWRWLFMIEGMPAVILGAFVLLCLPDNPASGTFLSASEKTWLANTLAAEQSQYTPGHSHAWRQALLNWRVWVLAMVWLLQAFGTIGVTLFMPLLIKTMSAGDTLLIGLLSALPFLLACMLMYANGRHSDHTGERALHLGLPLLFSGLLLAFCILTARTSPVAAYGLLVGAVGFNWAATPVFWATTANQLSGAASAAGIALVNAMAQFAGMRLPPIIGRIKDATGSYDLGMLLIAAALATGGLLGLKIGSRQATTASTALTSFLEHKVNS